MNQTQRVISLLRLLPRQHGTSDSSAAALARRFDTTPRTIYRDIQLLQDAGIAVCCDRRGYYLLSTENTLPAKLTSSELSALVYGLQWVSDAIPPGLQSEFEAALGKLAASGTDDAVRASLEGDVGIDVHPPTTDGPAATANFLTAIRARQQGRKLCGVYCSPERDEQTERTLHPYAIIYRGHAHYLVAYCELRKEERTFRLDRFKQLRVTDAPADIPDGYDPHHHFAGAWEVTSGRRQLVRLRVTGIWARRLRLSQVHPSQEVLLDTADALELRVRVAITDEFRSWVLGLGPEVEIMAPKSLRKQIAKTARQIAASYDSK